MGKINHFYGKSPFCMGKSTISMERSTILYGIYPTKKKKRVMTLFKHRAAPQGKGGGHHQDQRNYEGGLPRVVVIPLGASIV